MKRLLSLLVLLGASIPLLAQTAVKPKSEPRATAKTAVKASPPAASERALEFAELAIAERVYVGRLPCELGQFVLLEADPRAPGYFTLSLKKNSFRMHAVQSKSGAVRLDAVNGEAAWIQLANKSMLVNTKLGKRMADVCTSPEQQLVALAYEKSPPPSLLDDAPPASPAPVVTAESDPAAAPAAAPNPTVACRATGLTTPSNPSNGEKPC
jgi:hypothetical protein